MPELANTLVMAFLGAFHPVLVHLPIGILCFAVVLDTWCRLRQRTDFQQSLVLLYVAGACGAWLSAGTGWILANSGDYAGDLLTRHRWSGIGTALYSTLLAWVTHSQRLPGRQTRDTKRAGGRIGKLILPAGMLVLIVLTGHWGGSLTHGEGYLLKQAPGFLRSDAAPEETLAYPVADPAKALAYRDVAAVMLSQKCVGCHGPQKQKGKLRLDQAEFLFRGGKHGEVVLPGKPGESELLRRLLLPMNDDEHMPPKEKAQLSREEIAYLHWWISSGADTMKTVAALAPPDSLQQVFRFFQGKGVNPAAAAEQVPEPIGEANPALLDSLEKRGLLLLPLSRESRNLDVSFLNTQDSTDVLLGLLEPLAPFIIHLDLAGKPCTDKGLAAIGKLTRLRTLNLSRTGISDQGMPALAGLKDLEKLNLSSTAITVKGLQAIGQLQGLRAIFLFQTRLDANALADLQKRFPAARIDTGGYRLPSLETDIR